MFNLGITNTNDLQKEYEDKAYIFEEIDFLEKLYVCLEIYEAVKDEKLQIDEFKIMFKICEHDNFHDIELMRSCNKLILGQGYYFDIKSRAHNMDYFSSSIYDLGDTYFLSENGGENYKQRVNNKNYVYYKILKDLNSIGQGLFDGNGLGDMFASTMGKPMEPNLNSIIQTLGGMEMYNTWLIARDKNELEKIIDKVDNNYTNNKNCDTDRIGASNNGNVNANTNVNTRIKI